jgi:hypothetical protein
MTNKPYKASNGTVFYVGDIVASKNDRVYWKIIALNEKGEYSLTHGVSEIEELDKDKRILRALEQTETAWSSTGNLKFSLDRGSMSYTEP